MLVVLVHFQKGCQMVGISAAWSVFYC